MRGLCAVLLLRIASAFLGFRRGFAARLSLRLRFCGGAEQSRIVKLLGAALFLRLRLSFRLRFGFGFRFCIRLCLFLSLGFGFRLRFCLCFRFGFRLGFGLSFSFFGGFRFGAELFLAAGKSLVPCGRGDIGLARSDINRDF